MNNSTITTAEPPRDWSPSEPPELQTLINAATQYCRYRRFAMAFANGRQDLDRRLTRWELSDFMGAPISQREFIALRFSSLTPKESAGMEVNHWRVKDCLERSRENLIQAVRGCLKLV